MMIYPLSNLIIPGGHVTWKEYTLLREWGSFAAQTPILCNNAIFLEKMFNPIRIEWEEHLRSKGIKDRFGLITQSGARTLDYTNYLISQGIPAAKKSQHMLWKARDITPEHPSITVRELWDFIRPRWKGRLEDPHHTTGWVHYDTLNYGTPVTFIP